MEDEVRSLYTLEIEHPLTHICFSGIQLGPGAKLWAEDLCSSDAGWEPALRHGAVVPVSDARVWVRPRAFLTYNARYLLRRMAVEEYLVTKLGGRWRMIPTPYLKQSSLDWPADGADELLTYGHIELVPPHEDVYALSAIGRELHLKLPN